MYKIKEGCPGCGACIGSCPVKAIKIEGISAVIGEGCIDCGACCYSCPVKLIEKGSEDKTETKAAAEASGTRKSRTAEKPEERNGDA